MAKYVLLTICVVIGVLISVSAFAGVDKSNSPKLLGIPLYTAGENIVQRTVTFIGGIVMAVTFLYIIGKFSYLDTHDDIPQYYTPMLTREEREYQQWLARYRDMVGIVPDEYIPEKAKKALESEGYVFDK